MTEPTLPAHPADPTVPDADEHLQVLRLLENGEITADEAGHLLDALDADPNPFPGTVPAGATMEGSQEPAGDSGAQQTAPGEPRPSPPRLRIRVSDTETGRSRVNITIPLGFLDAGYRLARRIVPDRVPDPTSFQDAIRDGFRGHLIDVTEGAEHVEILVE